MSVRVRVRVRVCVLQHLEHLESKGVRRNWVRVRVRVRV